MTQEQKNMVQVDNEIAEYFELNEKSKDIGKIVDKLKATLKKAFKIGDTYQTPAGYELSISSQTRTSMDNSKLLEILKLYGHTDAIKTVEIPDDEAVKQLVYEGKLTAEMMQPAIKSSESAVLKVKYKGVKADAIQEKTPAKKARKKPAAKTKDTF